MSLIRWIVLIYKPHQSVVDPNHILVVGGSLGQIFMLQRLPVDDSVINYAYITVLIIFNVDSKQITRKIVGP